VAKKEIVIPNLIPGKRYRMVVETPATTGQPTLLAPSIEFVVPSAPRLISTYTPAYRVIPENWSTSTTTTETVVGSTVNIGDNQSAKSYTHYTTGWTRWKDWNRYVIYTDTYPESIGQSQLTWNHHDAYYKLLVFNFVSVSYGPYVVTNSDGGKQYPAYAITVDAVVQKYGTYGRTGTAYSSGSSSANQNLYYSRPALPTAAYKNADTTKEVTTTTSGTYYHVEVAVPSEIQKDLTSTDNVKKIPVFFYIQNGSYFYFDDSAVGSVPLTLATTPVVEMVKRNNYANANVSARDYRFTIAKYTKSGSNWYGEWEQKLDTYESIGPSISRVISSQSAVAR